MHDKPEFKPGDKVILNLCPKYRSACGSHRGKVLGEPQLKAERWVVPIRFHCLGIAHANYPCSELVKIRSSKVKLSKPAVVTAIVLVALVIIGGWLAGNYNSLVASNNAVKKSWGGVQTQYQRRFDTIDNLVETVKGAQKQEIAVTAEVAKGRNPQTVDGAKQADAASTTIVASLQRLQEAYPELRSNQQVTTLMSDLKSTEGDVLVARNNYNNIATNYNTNISSFPKSIFAAMFGFKERELFQSEAGAEKGAKVKF